MTQLAIMNIEKGEEIAIAVVSGSIPGTGRYKFFAKKNIVRIMSIVRSVELEDNIKATLYPLW